MSDEIITRECGCTSDEACNLCGFEACQLAWREITALKEELKRERETVDKINKVSHYPTDGFISLERMKEFAREAQKQRKIEL